MRTRLAAALLGALLIFPASSRLLAEAPAGGFQSDLIANIDDVGKKVVDLARAVPADKFAWRPASGVRSVSEVYMHIAAGNYLIPSFLGVKRPEGMDRTMETKVTDKAQVVETLQKSIAHLRAAVEGISDADLDKKVKFFGREMTERALLLHVTAHLHEHLGQSIAYARMNGIVPPWNASESEPSTKSSSK